MDAKIKNKYCLVIAGNGDTHINGFIKSARIETLQEFGEFETENDLVTYIASDNVSKYAPIPSEGEKCEYLKVYAYGDNKAKCLQEHIRMHYAPEETPALWLIIETIESGYPEWVQPTGAHDAYQKGDRISFKGNNYESLIDANVWSPSVYPAGWKQI
jgi:hypothetical protein